MSLFFFSALCALLTTAAMIDARTQRLPDGLNAAIAGLGLAVVLWSGASLSNALLGMAFGYLAIWGVNALHRARRGRDGIGMGDAKLLAAGGVWVGWLGVPFVLVFASSLALVVLGLKALRRGAPAKADKIAFGPFLAAGIAVVVAINAWVV